jgi:hypothetical protein
MPFRLSLLESMVRLLTSIETMLHGQLVPQHLQAPTGDKMVCCINTSLDLSTFIFDNCQSSDIPP